jgi:hypothetical protein
LGRKFSPVIITGNYSFNIEILKLIYYHMLYSMLRKKSLLFVLIIFACCCIPVSSQEFNPGDRTARVLIDSLVKAGLIRDTVNRRHEVTLTREEAIKFLQKSLQPQVWRNAHDPFRTALGQLVFESTHQPYDSAEFYLKAYPFDSISIPRDEFFIWEPVRIKIPGIPVRSDTVKSENAANPARTDSAGVRSILPSYNQAVRMKDTTVMIAVDTLKEVSLTSVRFPFRYYRYPYQSDSLRAAVGVLLDLNSLRDSSIVYITGVSGRKTSLWLNSKSEKMRRYWLNNDLNDSVTVWVGSPSRNTIGLYLENGVAFRRPALQGGVGRAKIEVQEQDRTKLLGIHKILTRTQFWKYHTEASAALSQGYLSNWVKGGESSISTALDITAYADYENKPMLMSSGNFIRLKYGLLATPTEGIRKNIDLLETNSKLNHKAFGRFDFSAILLFKTQVSKGKNYINDTVSVLVSKFMNPAMLTIGFGLDYKPNKTTSINFSPLSYKLTLITDTGKGRIDQTLYGIAKNRKALHEPGVSFMVTNEFKPTKNMSITNRLQLFTNYIHNPLNVDVDWEMILTANLNWFTDVRLNTHLIFDDDTKTPVYDAEKNPVTGPDGLAKKTARIQFKELLGLSFVFRF